MDATTTVAKAVASGADANATPLSPRAAAPEALQRRQEPLPGEDTTADVGPESATATTTSAIQESEGGCEDEQVVKFYALLANIRAMRGMYRGSGGDGACSSTDVTGEVGSGSGRKRARWAEPVWRPAFRMEDFEEAPGSASKKDRKEGASGQPGKETSTDEAADGEGDH